MLLRSVRDKLPGLRLLVCWLWPENAVGFEKPPSIVQMKRPVAIPGAVHLAFFEGFDLPELLKVTA